MLGSLVFDGATACSFTEKGRLRQGLHLCLRNGGLKSLYYFLRSLVEKNSKRFVLEIMKVSGALPSKYFYTYSTEEH